MKILYVNHYGKTISGAERVMLNLAKCLRDLHGVDITVICPAGQLSDSFHALGIDTRIVEMPKFRRTLNPVFWGGAAAGAAALSKEIRSLARSGGYDLLYSNSYVAHLYSALPARAVGLPTVWHMHDILKPLAVNKRIVPFASAKADAVIAVSDAVRRSLIELGAESKKISAALNGMDISGFEKAARQAPLPGAPEKEPGDLFVTMVGQVSFIKGQKQFVEAALDLLRTRKEKLKFIIVGDAQDATDIEYKNALISTVEKSGASKNILFTGLRGDVPTLLSMSDILVHASATSDSCPMSVLEYLCAEKPVVASRIGGTPELVTHGENGLLFTPGDAAGLRDCIALFLDNPDKAATMAAAGRKRILENHTLETHTDRVFQILKRHSGKTAQ